MRRLPAPVLMVVLCAVIAGCSMQKTGSKVEAARSDRNSARETSANPAGGGEKSPLRVDYLTPVDAVRSPEIFVYKDKRRLYVIQSNVLVRDYPIGLGLHPVGDKEKEGDGRTPEGDFVVCAKGGAGRFSKSLGLNYPDRKHAERAFFSGVLTPIEFKDILAALERKGSPPWNTALGGKIYIHAGGAHKDWTDGCVALYDSDMEELFKIAGPGTPVSIRP